MIKLRELQIDDREWLVRYLNNEWVVRYLSSRIPQPYTFNDANWWVEIGSKQSALVKAITLDEVFCGVVGIYLQEAEYSDAELGYWVAEDYWNRGIATRAVTEFTSLVFSTTRIQRIYNPVSAPNLASIKVMEKTGYNLERIVNKAAQHNGHFYDEHLFAKVRA